MNTNVLNWVEQTFLNKAAELGASVPQETRELLRSANAEATDRLQAHPRAFLKMKAQLQYWVERHAEVAALLAQKVAKSAEILPGHYADAVSIVTAWKPAADGSTRMAPTPLCPSQIDVFGRIAMKQRAA